MLSLRAMTGWLSFLSPILAGVAGATVTAAIARRAMKRTVPDRLGWHHVRPSAMHWTALVGSSGAVALCLYIRLFVGSARADAEFQMQVLNLIIAGFAICIAITAWQVAAILRQRLHWRGQQIAREVAGGELEIRSMRDVIEMHRSWNGTVRLAFVDGTVLKLDQYATSVHELWERVVEVND